MLELANRKPRGLPTAHLEALTTAATVHRVLRIAYISDLPVDVTPQSRVILPLIAHRIRELAPEVFVLAGDVANSHDGLELTLSVFEGVCPYLLFVPGNLKLSSSVMSTPNTARRPTFNARDTA